MSSRLPVPKTKTAKLLAERRSRVAGQAESGQQKKRKLAKDVDLTDHDSLALLKKVLGASGASIEWALPVLQALRTRGLGASITDEPTRTDTRAQVRRFVQQLRTASTASSPSPCKPQCKLATLLVRLKAPAAEEADEMLVLQLLQALDMEGAAPVTLPSRSSNSSSSPSSASFVQGERLLAGIGGYLVDLTDFVDHHPGSKAKILERRAEGMDISSNFLNHFASTVSTFYEATEEFDQGSMPVTFTFRETPGALVTIVGKLQ